MSLIAGLHLGELALIAADKREVLLYGDMVIYSNDDTEKIVDAGIGYITGSGFTELLDPVKQAVSEQCINHTDQIIQIIRREREEFRRSSRYGRDATEDYISKTGWLFSYRTISDALPQLRIAIVHPSLGDNIALLEEGTAKILVPIDGGEDEIKSLTLWVNERLRTTEEIPNYMKSLQHHIPILQAVFHQVSNICESVSEEFHVGVMAVDGAMMISREINSSTTSIEFLP